MSEMCGNVASCFASFLVLAFPTNNDQKDPTKRGPPARSRGSRVSER